MRRSWRREPWRAYNDDRKATALGPLGSETRLSISRALEEPVGGVASDVREDALVHSALEGVACIWIGRSILAELNLLKRSAEGFNERLRIRPRQFRSLCVEVTTDFKNDMSFQSFVWPVAQLLAECHVREMLRFARLAARIRGESTVALCDFEAARIALFGTADNADVLPMGHWQWQQQASSA